jgi:hypothetical protein
MNHLLKSINIFLYQDFVLSPQYRVLRHVTYWVFHTLAWAAFWIVIGTPGSYGLYLINMAIWLPIFILFGYPMAYWAVPHFLLKGRILQFLGIILVWAFVGMVVDEWYKDYIMIPLQKALHQKYILPEGPQAFCYLCITTAAAVPMIIQFFKHWKSKQQDWLDAQQEKVVAELQLLKAQVHPHFLFNTLNNIYSVSLENSPKTPALILKLSSLLSYMLYDCKAAEVRLQKELEIMKNYIELERERYGNNIDISWNENGEIQDQFVAPLMILPFLENAFKHGTSEQLEKSWLSVDVSVEANRLKVKIANSKNVYATVRGNGLGIANIRKRLEFIYPHRHELKLSDEGHFFVIALMIQLSDDAAVRVPLTKFIHQPVPYETAMPAYR